MQRQVKCPDNVYLCNNDIYNILKNIESETKNIKCSNSPFCPPNFNGNPCDCMFQKIANAEATCNDLYGILGKESSAEIKNQIKYNLNQLAQLKLKLAALKKSPPFGTYDWWLETIWGANKIQNYIYIVSFTIAAIGLIYFTWSFLKEIFDVFTGHIGQTLTIIAIILIIAFVISFTVIFMDYSFSKKSSYTQPEGDFAEKNVEKYPKNMSFKDTLTAENITWIVSIPVTIIILFFGTITVMCYANDLPKIDSIPLLKYIGYALLLLLVSYIIIFNIYFTFLIPQLLIIGIILQRFIFRTTAINIGNIEGQKKLLYFVIPLLIIIGYVSYIFIVNRLFCVDENNSKQHIDPCTGLNIKETETKQFYALPYLFLFATILILVVYANLSVIKRFPLNEDQFDDSWGLYMSPLIKILSHCLF